MVCELSRNNSYFYVLSTEKLMKFYSHMHTHKFSDNTSAQPQGHFGELFLAPYLSDKLSFFK